MQTLILNSVPDGLYAKLRRLAEKRHRPVDLETINILEKAILSQEIESASSSGGSDSGWRHRRLLPAYQKLAESGALASDLDSTIGLSEERDAR